MLRQSGSTVSSVGHRADPSRLAASPSAPLAIALMPRILVVDPNLTLRSEVLKWPTVTGYRTRVVRTLGDAMPQVTSPTSVDLSYSTSSTAKRRIRMLKQDDRTATLLLLVCTGSTRITQLSK